MTQTTFKRQLSILVKGILESYKIDNLQLEVDIVSAVHRLSEEKKNPDKMVEVREDFLNSLLHGAATENEMAQMEGRVKACMGISVDGRSRYSDAIRFLIKMDKGGQPVEKYAKWCKDNPYDAPKFFKIADRPDLLMETWSMAFVEQREVVRPEHEKVSDVKSEEVQAIPNPYQRPSILREQVGHSLPTGTQPV